MAKFDFHPEAARAIDGRGENLRSRVDKYSHEAQRPHFSSQRVPHFSLTKDDIAGRITGQTVDEYKKEVTAIKFEGLDGWVEIKAEGVRELDKLAQLAHKYLAAKAAVSEQFLRDRIIDWLQQRFRSEIEEGLASFLLAQVGKAVVARTIVMPIANLCLEADLPFGPVEFKVLTADMMTTWYESRRSHCPEDKLVELDAWFDRLRKDIQGLAAVAFTVEADEDYAIEQCLVKAEEAVALLRVLHPANTSPHTTLYVRPLGSENIESYHAYRYESGQYKGSKEQVRWPFPSVWEMPEMEHGNRVLQNLIHLFSASERTDFQQRLFDALLIYSRNNISKEAYEKLIFCLVAVESMLLKNASEPIQDNIGERMAYLLGDSATERLDIEALVKRIYDIRSKFVHHGQRPTDMDTLARFMKNVWILFFHLILKMSEIKTKDEMIETLKSHKYR